jgi:L-fucose isomerase-like protein
MAGSDINVVSKNKAALSNTASNVATTVTIFGGPMRLKGFIIEPTDVPGVLTWKDGGTDVFDIETGNAAAGASTVQLNLPADGIKFKTSIQVSSTVAGANVATINGVTAFFA